MFLLFFLKFTPHFCAFTFCVRISLLDFVSDLLYFLRIAQSWVAYGEKSYKY